jgi:Winged helix DNA-binding domain
MTLRELNRATLARQMLLARDKRPVVKAIAHLLGLQAQLPRPPFTGLWSRLENFSRADLAAAVTKRTVVRATSMRGTIHLMTAADFLKFRQCLQPSLDAGLQAVLRERADALDLPPLLAVARAYFAKPHNFEDARDHLVSKFPRGDERAMGYAARIGVPLVQVPSADAWAYPAQSDFVSADAWLGKPVAPCGSAGPLVLRYLAAYGPSTVKDAQAWTGLANLEPVFASLGATLVTLPGPSGKPLYDLPDAPRPAADTPAPVRFLPEWDSVIVTRADERIVAKADRPRVFLPGLRVAALVLVDGMATASWKVSATSKKATLQIETFKPWPAARRREVAAEAEAVLRFVEPDVTTYDMKVTTA